MPSRTPAGKVDPDYTATVGLDRDQARALLAAADTDTGPQRLRTVVVTRLLLHNALRVDELCAADVTDLGHDKGHRVLTVVRKGARKTKIPLTPATWSTLQSYLAARAAVAAVPVEQLSSPLVATATGGRMRQGQLWELVRRLARAAGIPAWEQISPHSLRHTAITLALDAGGDAAGRAGLRRPQGSPHHPTLRPHPRKPGPQRRVHAGRVPGLMAVAVPTRLGPRATRSDSAPKPQLPPSTSKTRTGSNSKSRVDAKRER